MWSPIGSTASIHLKAESSKRGSIKCSKRGSIKCNQKIRLEKQEKAESECEGDAKVMGKR
jgi:hypothetical protein